MKVLLCHNYYRSTAPSGEDSVFRNERDLLQRRGTETVIFEKHNNDIDESTFPQRVNLALNGAWSKPVYHELKALIKKTRPDIAHFHNTFPLITPSAYAACQDSGIPVIQTLHNYRMICPGALLQRAGRPCEDCVGRSVLPALRHRCYRDSITATAAIVWMLEFNRWKNSYRTLVDRYIALTPFAAGRLVAGGLPAERVGIKPNFLPHVPMPGTGGGGYAVYTGRLSQEKGIETLVRAWRDVRGLSLKILGDGPLRDRLIEAAKQAPEDIEFLGYCSQDRVLEIVGRAELQIVPSEWYEGMPMVVLEAYALGTPVVAARIGSLEALVENGRTGIKFSVGDANDLAEKVNTLWKDKSILSNMRHAARAVFEEQYMEESNYNSLVGIYNNVLEEYKNRNQEVRPSN